MNRTHLASAITALATGLGYPVFSEEQERPAPVIPSLPAAWLQPLRLKQIEGRRHGRQIHTVELRLLLPAHKLSPEERERERADAELQLISLFTDLSRHEKVVAVENLTIQPASGSYTPHGELSQTAKADVITYF